MKLIVVIPARNEDATIGGVISRVPARIDGVTEIKTLVVDDGSTDKTTEAALEAGAGVVLLDRHCGLGLAMRTGIAEAVDRGADIVAHLDADGQHDPADIPSLIGIILSGGADVAIASRFKDPALTPKMPLLKLWGNIAVARILSALCGRRFYDASCGFRAYSREAAQSLDLKGDYTYTQESLLFLTDRGFRIEETPMKIRGSREFGESRVANNVLVYGFNALFIILRYLKNNRLRGKRETKQNEEKK